MLPANALAGWRTCYRTWARPPPSAKLTTLPNHGRDAENIGLAGTLVPSILDHGLSQFDLEDQVSWSRAAGGCHSLRRRHRRRPGSMPPPIQPTTRP